MSRPRVATEDVVLPPTDLHARCPTIGFVGFRAQHLKATLGVSQKGKN
jgi:hypothetical protein